MVGNEAVIKVIGVGEHRAMQAARSCTSSPLLEQTIHGAKGLLVNITSSDDLTLNEVHEAMSFIHSLCDPDEANIFFGTVVDPAMKDSVRITILATGFDPQGREASVAAAAVRGLGLGEPEPEPVIDPTPATRGTTPQRVAGGAPTVQQVWEKASAETRKAVSSQNAPGQDLDIPAFIRENQQKKS